MKAIVAGAGVGGLTTAIALRARGVDVELLEAAPTPRVSGGGLGIAPNATKVLRALGVDLPKTGVGRVCERFDLRTASGRPIRELPITSIAEELGAPIVNVRRADLIAVLREALADTPIHHGAKLARYERSAAGVLVTGTDGRTWTGDLLVGADGIRSAVRAQLAGPEPIREYGYVCWIATVPFHHPSLPPGGAVHYWGNGQRFGLIDVNDGNAYWWGTKNARGWTGTKAEILRSYTGWADEVRAVISATPAEDILTVPAQDRSFLESWGDGPVTLVGDAAHPMLTSLSQGAGSAIEDGYELAHHVATSTDPITGLRRYEQARRDRARWLVSASRRLSRFEQFANPIIAGLRNTAIRHLPMATVRRQNIAPMRFELPA